MTYTNTTWSTLAVTQVKGFVVVYRNPDGRQAAAEAPVVLVQHDPATGTRREVFASVDKTTGELIPAPDVPGYLATVCREDWRNNIVLSMGRDFTPIGGELA
ncbi:hypothetical protein [Mycolicibacterium confluentis]|uniref:Uncharacterized protein n=1 Tax=Mycolicibacterium confluentis TaxID=28047 RepID=A0A7I7XXG7_9MYCO|nr:hypothetical protein [Mycolicibacterium confluentis]MCV7318395.1 hypothetical protein [Mycolicibacterium confluentis]ORV20228.1 hypothetical protein AWB99_07190 [Mycolicibacterium confluentis]BBZ34065.1 hypothetical protein MCNF_26700 [Mycolicibacterium confluentis]